MIKSPARATFWACVLFGIVVGGLVSETRGPGAVISCLAAGILIGIGLSFGMDDPKDEEDGE